MATHGTSHHPSYHLDILCSRGGLRQDIFSIGRGRINHKCVQLLIQLFCRLGLFGSRPSSNGSRPDGAYASLTVRGRKSLAVLYSGEKRSTNVGACVLGRASSRLSRSRSGAFSILLSREEGRLAARRVRGIGAVSKTIDMGCPTRGTKK